MLYLVTDSYGTRKLCWTMNAAMAWLPFCSPAARVRNFITGKTLVVRNFSRVY